MQEEVWMSCNGEIKEGQTFRDKTGLTVRAGKNDVNDRVHFSVTGSPDATSAEPGDLSYFAFTSRFTRIDSVKKRVHGLSTSL
jgi:hypothetical protein